MTSPEMLRSAMLHFSSTPAGQSLLLSFIIQNVHLIPCVDSPCCFLVPIGDLLFLSYEYLTPALPQSIVKWGQRMIFPMSLPRKIFHSLFLLGTGSLRSPKIWEVPNAKLRTVTVVWQLQTHWGTEWEKHLYSSLRVLTELIVTLRKSQIQLVG